MKQRVHLFDFDGTLVDSMPVFSENMLRFLKEEKVDYPADIIKIITPLGYSGTAAYFREHLGVVRSVEEIIDRCIFMSIPKYRDEIPLKESVSEYLHLLKQHGESLNVLTASPHSVLDVCLQRNGIYALFDNVWSCEDFGTTKSDPQIYLDAAERIAVSPQEVAFYDDNINAVRTAKQARLYTVGVWDESGREFAEPFRALADRYICSFSELCAEEN